MISHIYIVSAGPFVKIGKANDVDKRIASMQTGSPYEIEFIHSSEVPLECAHDVEREAHSALSEYRFRGEWFMVEPAVAVEVVTTTAEAAAATYKTTMFNIGCDDVKKSDVISMFGGTQLAVAKALGITNGAVSQWPSVLPKHLADRVIGAAYRLGKISTRQSSSG